jgi:hypothetical protein
VGYILPPLCGFCTEHGSNTAWFPSVGADCLCFGTLVFSIVGSRLPLGFRALVQNCRHTAAQFAGRFLRPRTEGPQQM